MFKVLFDCGDEMFVYGVDFGFDLVECLDNEFNLWIGV